MRQSCGWMRSVVVATTTVFTGCGALGPLTQLIQPPRFDQSRPAEIRLMSPSLSNPAGGAGVTLWLDVTNPNPFGFTLSTVDATLLLEGSRAASGSFPLGLPLQAGQTSTVPIDLSISFADLPGLADAVRQITGGGSADVRPDAARRG